MNKNIPEFFAKRNNSDPIYIKPLSVVENHKKVLKVVKIKEQPVLIPNFSKFRVDQDKQIIEVGQETENDTPVFQSSEESGSKGSKGKNGTLPAFKSLQRQRE
jgi:hypothetical protein